MGETLLPSAARKYSSVLLLLSLDVCTSRVSRWFDILRMLSRHWREVPSWWCVLSSPSALTPDLPHHSCPRYSRRPSFPPSPSSAHRLSTLFPPKTYPPNPGKRQGKEPCVCACQRLYHVIASLQLDHPTATLPRQERRKTTCPLISLCLLQIHTWGCALETL